MEITVRVVDLLHKVREMNRAEMDFVTLCIYEGEVEDGEVLPKTMTFTAFTKQDPYLEISYDDIVEVFDNREDRPRIFTTIK